MSLSVSSMAASSGMAILISLVRLSSSLLPSTGKLPTFLRVAGLGLMADDAHDVGLFALFIDRVTHGLAVDSQRTVFLAMGFIPALQGVIEFARIDADQEVADDGLAGHQIATLFATTAETLPGPGAQTIGPVGNGFVTAHPTQDRGGGNSEHGGQPVAPSLAAAGVGDGEEECGQGPHEFGTQP